MNARHAQMLHKRLNLIGVVVYCVGTLVWIFGSFIPLQLLGWARPFVLITVFGGAGLMVYAWWLKRRLERNAGN